MWRVGLYINENINEYGRLLAVLSPRIFHTHFFVRSCWGGRRDRIVPQVRTCIRSKPHPWLLGIVYCRFILRPFLVTFIVYLPFESAKTLLKYSYTCSMAFFLDYSMLHALRMPSNMAVSNRCYGRGVIYDVIARSLLSRAICSCLIHTIYRIAKWYHWLALNLAICLQTGHSKILAEFKIGGGPNLACNGGT